MTARKTLIILTPGFPSDENDTTCLPMQQALVKAIRNIQPDLMIRVLTFQYPYFIRNYDWFGVSVSSFNGQNKGGISRLLLRKKILPNLSKISQSAEITGLLSFWAGECAAVGSLFARKKELIHRCWILGQDARKENKYPGRVKFDPSELIAVSDFIREEFFRNHHLIPQQVIPPGIDRSLFAEISPEKDLDLFAAGSLIPLKRFDIFLEIVATLQKKFPELKAALAGNGPEMKSLKDQASQSGLDHSLQFFGELPHPDLMKVMQRAKLFIHPSSYEGFSGVCQEALAAGAGVVSFCKPMNHDIPGWHIVRTKEEMKIIGEQLLGKKPLGNALPDQFDIDDSANKILGLFS